MEDGNGNRGRDEIYSKAVKAGKRTYFFDVKTTRGNDLYLTITESKKKFHNDGKVSYEKHKLFLYKEDFDKFAEGLEDAIRQIRELWEKGDYTYQDNSPRNNTEESSNNEESSSSDSNSSSFTDIDFDDLDK